LKGDFEMKKNAGKHIVWLLLFVAAVLIICLIGDRNFKCEVTYYQVYRNGQLLPKSVGDGFNSRVPEKFRLKPPDMPKTVAASEEPEHEPDAQAVKMLKLHELDTNPLGVATNTIFVRPDQTMPGESVEDELNYQSENSSTYRFVMDVTFKEIPDFMQEMGFANLSEKDVGRSLADILGCQQEILCIKSADKSTGEEYCRRYPSCYLKGISDNKKRIVIETADVNFIECKVDDKARYGVTWLYVNRHSEIILTTIFDGKEVQP